MKLLLICAVMASIQIQVNPSQQPAARAGIEGSVTRTGGQPLAGARVTITRSTAGAGPAGNPAPAIPAGATLVNPAAGRGAAARIPSATTDDKGKFSFTGLDEGTYTIEVQANGYVPQVYGQRFPGGPRTPVLLTSGQTTKDIAIALTPAANVSGRIRDTSDRPVANIPVRLLRYTYDSNGQRTYQAALAQ